MSEKRDTVIKMANEAGCSEFKTESGNDHARINHFFECSISELEKFSIFVWEAAQEYEREACAQICDGLHDEWRWDDEPDSGSGPRSCASAIRERHHAKQEGDK